MSASTSIQPLGYLGIDLNNQPQTIVADRPPTVNDIQFPGTVWIERSVTPRVIYQTTGGGVWIISSSSVLPVSLTDHGVVLGQGTDPMVATAVGATGEVLIGSTGADPAFGALGVNSGLTDHGVLVGSGNAAITALAVGATGTVLAGSTGADPAFTATPTLTTLTATTINGTTITTNVAAAQLSLTGTTVSATGSDANISVTVTPKGTGDFVVNLGDIQATAGDIIASRSSAAGEVTVEVTNSDNTSADSDAFVEVAVGGTSSGNPGIRFQISGGQNYSMGIDNASASDDLLIGGDNDVGTDPILRIAEAGDVTVEKGNLIINAAAKQLQIQGGAVTDFIGQATLTAGTVTVLNTNIAAGDKIYLSRQGINGSTALGVFDYAITPATSFVITSRNPTDATTQTNDVSIVDYVIVRQL